MASRVENAESRRRRGRRCTWGVPRACRAVVVVAAFVRAAFILATIVFPVVLALPAFADITVEGTVKYWDELEGDFRPAKYVMVEVERDWALIDPVGQTDDKGHYSIKIPNPMWGTHNGVHIEVYAETRNILEVYESIISPWPYEVHSRDFHNVPSDKPLTIDLQFGEPAPTTSALGNINFVGLVPGWGPGDAPKAFLVHQEMTDHRSALRNMHWPQSAFGEKEVIVPAFLPDSYYNHFTNNINLSTGGWTGMGTWSSPSPNSHQAVSYNHFLHMLRHEYSHAIHDEITVLAPFGLNLPWVHDPWTETNSWVAYTEGFADLLPLMTIGQGGQWEPDNLLVGRALIKGDGWAKEGEVTGVLWDLFDPKGYERLRHAANNTPDGLLLPKDVRKAQRWRDAIDDPDGARIRKIAGKRLPGGSLGATPVETIRSFIGLWKHAYPAELHALKAAVFNRDIAADMPAENPAHLRGKVSLRRWNRTLTLRCTAHESDVEDRKHVRLTVYHKGFSGFEMALPTFENVVLANGWQGSSRPVTIKFELTGGFRPGDALWLEINDDMLPTVYRLSVPVKDDGVVHAVPTNDKLAEAYGPLPAKVLAQLRGVPGGALSKTGVKKADFESPSGTWRYTGAAAVKGQGGQHVLEAAGFSHGIWDAGLRTDFQLRLRYRHGQGVGHIALCLSGEDGAASLYHLTMHAGTLVLSRESEGLKVDLAVAKHTFTPGRWHGMLVEQAGGRFRVFVDKTLVLEAADADPLPGGMVAFGSLLGTGFAFDDISIPRRSVRLDPGLGDRTSHSAGAAAAAAAAAEPRPAGAPPLTAEYRQRVQRVRTLVRSARMTLRAHAERQDLRARQRRALYRWAGARGDLTVHAEPRALFRETRVGLPQMAPLTAAQRADLRAFEGWLDARALGKSPPKALRAKELDLMAEQLRSVEAGIRAQEDAPKQIAKLSKDLTAATAGLVIRDKVAAANTRRTVDELVKALRLVARDGELLEGLRTQAKAFETLKKK